MILIDFEYFTRSKKNNKGTFYVPGFMSKDERGNYSRRINSACDGLHYLERDTKDGERGKMKKGGGREEKKRVKS